MDGLTGRRDLEIERRKQIELTMIIENEESVYPVASTAGVKLDNGDVE